MGEFKYSDKKVIDFAVPSICAGAVAGYFILRKGDRDYRFLILLIVLAWVLTYGATSAITKLIRDQRNKPEKVSVPPDNIELTTDPNTGETTTVSKTSNVNISGLCQKLRDDLYDTPFFGHSEDIWHEAATLSDTDLAAVHNEWVDKFYHEYSESLLSAINDDYWIYNSAAYNNKEIVVTKLKRINAK